MVGASSAVVWRVQAACYRDNDVMRTHGAAAKIAAWRRILPARHQRAWHHRNAAGNRRQAGREE